jgi:hypothetical protein
MAFLMLGPLAWAASGGLQAQAPKATGVPAKSAEAPAQPAAKSPELERRLKHLARERLQVAQRGYDDAVDLYRHTQRSGQTIMPWVNVDQVYIWSRRWMEQECALSTKKSECVAAHEHHLKRLRRLEKLARELRNAELVTKLEPLAAEFYRLEAESSLAEAKAK